MITSSVGQSNNVQVFSAVNALRGNNRSFENRNEASGVQVEATASTPVSKGILDRINVAEVRECAKYVGEYNISDEDIKYGMIYGRSVIAEYLA